MSSNDTQQRRASRLFVYGVLDPKDELDEVSLRTDLLTVDHTYLHGLVGVN